MQRTIAVLVLCFAATTTSAAPLPIAPSSGSRLDAWSRDFSTSTVPTWTGEQPSRFAQSQSRRAQGHQRRVQARRDPAPNRATSAAQAAPSTPQPAPFLRNAELSGDAAVAPNAPSPVATGSTPPAGPQIAQVQSQALPRSRNESAPTDSPGSYSARAAGYFNDAVDYMRGGLGSLSGYLPAWPFGWSGSESTGADQVHERLLVEAMRTAGFELVSVARDGTLLTTVTYTFRQQRRPSPADRLLAAKLAADLSAANGGLSGHLEQAMIKAALEGGETTTLDVQSFELQTRPYPWLKSVAGPRSTNQ
jgi:hypothetical protein